MGTKGPKAGNIFTSLRSRGLVGNQGQDPSIKGMGSAAKFTPALEKKAENGELKGKFAQAVMANKSGGSPLKQTKDGSDASVFGSVKRVAKNVGKALVSNAVGNLEQMVSSVGQGNRHMDGPAPSPDTQQTKQQPPSKSKSKPDKQTYSASKSENKTPFLKKKNNHKY